MNISEASAVARILAGHGTRTDRELLALNAGKALQLRIDPGHPARPADRGTWATTPPPIATYCRQHGVRRAECGCTQ